MDRGNRRSLDAILDDLRSSNLDTRLAAAEEFHGFVLTPPRPMTGNALNAFHEEVHKRCLGLVDSRHVQDKLAGLMAIENLADVFGNDMSRAVRLSSSVQRAFLCSDASVVTRAAKIFARLALQGGLLMAVQVDSQFKRCIEWLQEEKFGSQRYTAVLVLRELIGQAPMMVQDNVLELLESLWKALSDQEVAIREVAAEVLAACLSIAEQRNVGSQSEVHELVFNQAQRGFEIDSPEAIHGALLVYEELLLGSKGFMSPRFVEVCDQILEYKDHPDFSVRRAVIELLPTLASYHSVEFSTNYLPKVMHYLFSKLDRSCDRATAYLTIGHVSLHVGSAMGAYLDAILNNIKTLLQARGRTETSLEDSIFQCISMLAQSVGGDLAQHLPELLDLMFAFGLSSALTQALRRLSSDIPPLVPEIRGRVLDQISLILAGTCFTPPGAPPRGATLSLFRPLEAGDTVKFQLALETLGGFNFSGLLSLKIQGLAVTMESNLGEFLRDIVLPYVEHQQIAIRRAAAVACCQVLANDPIIKRGSEYSMQLVKIILGKLLELAIGDPDSSIRQAVVSELHPQFDPFLEQAGCVRSLFIALNDQVYNVREGAMRIIGRLATGNPAYVMPSLRRTLIQLLTELEYSTVPRLTEEATTLLGLVARDSRPVLKPYIIPLLGVLLSKCRDPSPNLATAILTTIGEVAKVARKDMLLQIKPTMALILDALNDQSSPKRDAALKTLGQLCTYAGYVIEPYKDYPLLLESLTAILRTEPARKLHTRRETIRVMGIIGALDPHERARIEDNPIATAPDLESHGNLANPSDVGLADPHYFFEVVFTSLLNILADSSLSAHHPAVIEAILEIFQTMRLKIVGYLKKILPSLLAVIETCAVGLQEYYFQSLNRLIGFASEHIRNDLEPVMKTIQASWTSTTDPTLHSIIIDVVQSLAVALEFEFKPCLPPLLPLMLAVLDGSFTQIQFQTLVKKILRTFASFGSSLEEYLHLIIPSIVRTFFDSKVPILLRTEALQTISQLCCKIKFASHASRIIHPLAQVLSSPTTPVEIQNPAVDVLCALLIQMGPDFLSFVPILNKALVRNQIVHAQYDELVSKLLRREPLPRESLVTHEQLPPLLEEEPDDAGLSRCSFNHVNLEAAWTLPDQPKSETWSDWFIRFSVQLIKSSPELPLRACGNLAEVYPQLGRDLFNASFISCWVELSVQSQDFLVYVLKTALQSETITTDVTLNLLNLAEFMERNDLSLSIHPNLLSTYATNSGFYAKALHYKELEALQDPSLATMEQLINLNTQLQQSDAAVGILGQACRVSELPLEETWYIGLRKWDAALEILDHKAATAPSADVLHNRMRCLHALGSWEEILELASSTWETSDSESRASLAYMAANAAWGLHQWDSMRIFAKALKPDDPQRPWMRTVLAIQEGQYGKAEKYINEARDLLCGSTITTALVDSYSRSYRSTIVRCHMLAELDEVISYKKAKASKNRELQLTIQETWKTRLRGIKPDVDIWQRILKNQALVLTPSEHTEVWVKFANLCRKAGRFKLGLQTLQSLFGKNHSFNSDTLATPAITYSYLKCLWATGQQDECLKRLQGFTMDLVSALGLNGERDGSPTPNIVEANLTEEYTKLLARCYQKIGQWTSQLYSNWVTDAKDTIPEILQCYLLATNFDRTWFKAWQSWALANFEIVSEKAKQLEELRQPVPPEIFTDYVVPSIQAFFHSIELSKENSLQDTLRLLTLLFNYGSNPEVREAISDGFKNVRIETWLQVIPQLIARIYDRQAPVRKLVQRALTDAAKARPHALIYPLTVASNTPQPEQRRAAIIILNKVREQAGSLVDQALLVSDELIRVAVLRKESWYQAIETAAQWYGQRDYESMLAAVEPLHVQLERRPETPWDVSFAQHYGPTLHQARESGRRYQQYNTPADLEHAFELYSQVWQQLHVNLKDNKPIKLEMASPNLLKVRDLDLAVPGTYRPGQAIVRIEKFQTTMDIIGTKQRPRVLRIIGSDGNKYQFLLKGNGDLRQDERVMQLFGLVNTLLKKDDATSKRHLAIVKYDVIPLSPYCGLLAWVERQDTLHELLKEYRLSHQIEPDLERQMTRAMAPDSDNLSPLQKLEVFEYVSKNTSSHDLYRIMWLKSRNSEAWLDRRTNYTRTLAVMSMVGHILGLGDRHPANLLIHKDGGQVIHIDFGDCFERAMSRKQAPEKVPFRLTRMLTSAMEISGAPPTEGVISGIEGTFKITCQHTMRVLRENKESIMAVLNAFVHDPLMDWGVMPQGPEVAKLKEVKPRNVERLKNTGGAPSMSIEHQSEIIKHQFARNAIERVEAKLKGRDFGPTVVLSVEEQVDKLIAQATASENLAVAYIGWCAHW